VAPSRDLRVTVLTATCWFGGLAHPALCKVPGWKQLHGADGKGALLREICETYDFEADHSTFKSMFTNIDNFMIGAPHLGLLLGWGDFFTVRKGFVKVVAGYQAVAERVRKGESDWADYLYETWLSRGTLVAALLLAEEKELLSEYVAHCGYAEVLTSDKACAAFKKHWSNLPFAAWEIDGYRVSSLQGQLLHMRELVAWLEPATDEANARLRAWLPSAAELLRISKYETGWSLYNCGPAHVGLLGGALHGSRLGDWATAAEIAEGVLEISNAKFNPLVQIEALRLLARSCTARGMEAGATDASERALAVASEVSYPWMEMLVLRDMPGPQERLAQAVSRVRAKPSELTSILRARHLQPRPEGEP